MKTFYTNFKTTICLAIILLLIAWFSSCKDSNKKWTIINTGVGDVSEFIYQGHEYIQYSSGAAHKGNCKACDSIQDAKLMRMNLSIQRQIAHYFLYDSRTKEVRGGRVYYQVTNYDQNGN